MALRNMVLPHPLVSHKIIIHSLYKKNMYIYIYLDTQHACPQDLKPARSACFKLYVPER